MEVRDVHPAAAARVRRPDIGDEPSPVESPQNEVRPQLRIVSDRVVISSSARTALDEMRKMPAVDYDIRSKLNGAAIPDARLGEIYSRIDHGYYKQYGVLRHVVGVVTGVLEHEL